MRTPVVRLLSLAVACVAAGAIARASSSNASVRTCGPVTAVCAADTAPQCIAGSWHCVPTLFPDDTPNITSLLPDAGAAGTRVTIRGTGFSSVGNSVSFGDSLFADIPSDGNTLSFMVPSATDLPCMHSEPRCMMPSKLLKSGNYAVSVRTNRGTSNSQNFLLTPS